MNQLNIEATQEEDKNSSFMKKTNKFDFSYHHLILAASAVIFISSVIIGFKYKSKQITQKQQALYEKSTPTPTTTTPVDNTSMWKTYVSKENTFSIKYPSDWEVKETINPKNNNPIVEISKTQTAGMNFSVLSITKNEKLNTEGISPETLQDYEYSNWKGFRSKSTEDNIEFEAIAIIKSYSPDNTYQASWIYMSNGKNQYTTEEYFTQILSTFQFLPNISDWKTFTDEDYTISFKHPSLDSECCGIEGPLIGNAKRVIVLADKSTALPNSDKPFNGLAVYIEPNQSNKNFQEYLEEQKQSLLDNFKQFTQREPKPSEQSFTIDNQVGTLLKEYAWWADIIYVPFPNNKKVLIITKGEESEGSFDETFNQILSTFRFLD